MTVWKLHTVRNRNNYNAEFRLAERKDQIYVYERGLMHTPGEGNKVAV